MVFQINDRNSCNHIAYLRNLMLLGRLSKARHISHWFRLQCLKKHHIIFLGGHNMIQKGLSTLS